MNDEQQTDSTPRPRFTMIGNAHVDPAWMWGPSEGVEAFIATCRSALERMEENDRVCFSCSSAWLYAQLERFEPELFEQLRRRVEEGRWEIVGGWWTEADCNLPSGEGLMRQGMLGQEYFEKAFGRRATVGYSPDAFGHSAGLPQILLASGLDSYIFCRPDPTELDLPSPLFDWQSTDGSTVRAYRVPFHYNMYQTTVRKKVSDMAGQLHRLDRTEWALFYGIGNHGGGPTKEQIAAIEQIDREGVVKLEFGRIDRFVEEGQTENRPVVRGELQMNSPGTYTTHSQIKRLNRRCEAELLRAEMLDLLASTLGDRHYHAIAQETPVRLRDAWREVCYNHFHDLLCGVAIAPALEDTVARYGLVARTAEQVVLDATRAIARRIDTSEAERTLLVVNPYAFAVDETIDFELWHDIDKEKWGEPIDLAVSDEEGIDLPVQRIRTEGRIGDDRVGGRFAASIPPFGWRCFRVDYGRKSEASGVSGPTATDRLLENEHLRVEFADPHEIGDGGEGGISRIVHRASGLDLLSGQGIRPTAYLDTTDTWGHGTERFDREPSVPYQLRSVRLLESGPVSATVVLDWFSESAWLTMEATLAAGADYLDLDCRIRSPEPATFTKLVCSTSLTSPTTIAAALYDTTVAECDGRERPGGGWKGISGEIDGRAVTLGFADTMTHGYSAEGSDFRLSLVRTPIVAHHEPHEPTFREDTDRLDLGQIDVRIRLRPIVDAEPRSILERDAMILAAGPIAAIESPHAPTGDELPPRYSGIEEVSENLVLSSMRRDHRDGTQEIRLYEASGAGGPARLRSTALGLDLETEMRPHEVRTIES